MENKFKNYTAEEFMKLCFADDASRTNLKENKDYKFWENFKKLNIEEWKKGRRKIYDTNMYESLPDPDACSKRLYDVHEYLWNLQCNKFNIPKVYPSKDCELKINKTEIRLSSDSVMSIYWHWAGSIYPYKQMQQVIENISLDMKNKNEGYPQYDSFKEFICEYLHKSNKIGGFIVFPKHPSSINSRRGCSAQIRDRFDLTLECIRRAYTNGYFDNNPLFEISTKDKEFFNMFGKGKEGFENYAKFFCLNESYDGKQNWVKDGHVLNLMNNEDLDTYNFSEEPLPTNSEKWWIFYRNIMSRLDARNEQIKRLIQQKGD